MENVLRSNLSPVRPSAVGQEIFSFVAGLITTLALFLGIAHFKDARKENEAPAIEALRSVAMPPESPLHKEETPPETVEAVLPFAGLDIAASTSAVKVTVLPPDLDRMMPSAQIPPTAVIQTAQLFTDFKPKMSVNADFQRVYQQSEVDRRPTRDLAPNPVISARVRGGADTLRVRLMMIIDLDGRPVGVRITKSSGNPEFDVIVSKCIQEGWTFNPATKNGRKVKCLIEQPFSVHWSGGSPFSL